jgi:hypothetical protein
MHQAVLEASMEQPNAPELYACERVSRDPATGLVIVGYHVGHAIEDASTHSISNPRLA